MSAVDKLLATKAKPATQSATAGLPIQKKATTKKQSAVDLVLASRKAGAAPVPTTTPVTQPTAVPTPQAPVVAAVPIGPAKPNPQDFFKNPLGIKKPAAPPETFNNSMLRKDYKPSPAPKTGTITAPEPGFLDKPGFLSTTVKTAKDAFKDTVQRGVELSEAAFPTGKFNPETNHYEAPKVTPGDRASALLRAGMGAVNLAFMPLAAPAKGLEDIQLDTKAKKINPALVTSKYASKAVNKVFELAGEGGAVVAKKGFEKLPQTPEVQKFEPLAEETAAFLATLLIGKVAHETMKLPSTIDEFKKRTITTNDVVASAARVLDLPTEKNVLGQIKKVDPEAVKAKYRELAHDTHPDRGGTAQEFQVVNQAKAILQDHNTLSPKEFRDKYQAPIDKAQRAIKQLPESTQKTEPASATPALDKVLAEKTKKPVEQVAGVPNTEIVPVDQAATVLPEGSSVGTPSYKMVDSNVPETGSHLPSLKTETSPMNPTTSEPGREPLTSRYVSPSQLINTDSIHSQATTLQTNGQVNVAPFTADLERVSGVKPDVRVKKTDSLLGKIERYKIKGKAPQEIADVLAGRLIVSAEDVAKQIDNIKQNFKVKEIQNYFNKPSEYGYRGVNIQVELPNGMPAEVQIHTPESLTVANESHKIYEKWRNVDPKTLSDQQWEERAKDLERSKVLSEKASTTQMKEGARPVEAVATADARPKITENGPIERSKKLASAVYERLQAEHSHLNEELSYERQSLKENAEKAVDLIAENKEQAYRVAMGVEEPPKGQTSTAVNIAMAEKALEDGNHELYAQLVRNRSLEQTRRGQELVAEKGSVNDNSTSRYVKELIKARLDKVGRSYLGDLSDRLLKKTKPSRATAVIDREVVKVKERIKSAKELDLNEAQAFLDSLACK